ncbi:hypothetical protein [Enterococcus sp. UD-01]|uniref:hypothetical protein n=1 Tax=Enterococcus sp. UD-01 TaxID=3373911 RepID=UPI003836C2C8
MFNYEEGLKELKKLRQRKRNFTFEDLNALIRQISVDDPLANEDATTIMYSGMIDEVTHSHLLIEDLALRKDVRLLDRTPVAEFLRSNPYRDAVRMALLTASPNLKAKALSDAVNDYLYG